MRIVLSQYLMDRNNAYPEEFTPEVKANAEKTVERVNELLAILETEGIPLETTRNGSVVTSGWRPAAINKTTPGAAVKSKHMTAEACDLYDPEGEIDAFLMSEKGQQALVNLRLWHEHPSATKNWAHIQTVAPRSGNRTFYP